MSINDLQSSTASPGLLTEEEYEKCRQEWRDTSDEAGISIRELKRYGKLVERAVLAKVVKPQAVALSDALLKEAFEERDFTAENDAAMHYPALLRHRQRVIAKYLLSRLQLVPEADCRDRERAEYLRGRRMEFFRVDADLHSWKKMIPEARERERIEECDRVLPPTPPQSPPSLELSTGTWEYDVNSADESPSGQRYLWRHIVGTLRSAWQPMPKCVSLNDFEAVAAFLRAQEGR